MREHTEHSILPWNTVWGSELPGNKDLERMASVVLLSIRCSRFEFWFCDLLAV